MGAGIFGQNPPRGVRLRPGRPHRLAQRRRAGAPGASQPTYPPQGGSPWIGQLPSYSMEPGSGYSYSYGPFLPRPGQTFTQGAFGPFSPILPVPVDMPPDAWNVALTTAFVPTYRAKKSASSGLSIRNRALMLQLFRTTLAKERVALSNSSAFGDALETALALVGEHHDPETYEAMGRLLIDAQSLSQMRQRSLLRSVFGLEPGPEASLAKLLGAEHDQRVADFGVELLGPIGITASSDDGVLFTRQMLHTLCLTIAGGTSEVQRNVIGERLLGLPRDPEPQIQA